MSILHFRGGHCLHHILRNCGSIAKINHWAEHYLIVWMIDRFLFCLMARIHWIYFHSWLAPLLERFLSKINCILSSVLLKPLNNFIYGGSTNSKGHLTHSKATLIGATLKHSAWGASSHFVLCSCTYKMIQKVFVNLTHDLIAKTLYSSFKPRTLLAAGEFMLLESSCC